MTDYIVFFDESGSPNLDNIDPEYPVFGLAALIFERKYFEEALLGFDKLKVDNGFSADTIFHSSELRKQKGVFSILNTKPKFDSFAGNVSNFFQSLDFTLIASVIKTQEHKQKYVTPGCPYDLSFQFVIERIQHFLYHKDATVELFLERRTENIKDLSRIFKRLKENGNGYISSSRFESTFPQENLNFVTKENKGAQIADLVVYPITREVLGNSRNSQAFQILKPKFYGGRCCDIAKYGYKIFP